MKIQVGIVYGSTHFHRHPSLWQIHGFSAAVFPFTHSPQSEYAEDVAGYYFQSKLQDSIARNNQRSGKAVIPVKGIMATHRKLELPSLDEGFDQLFYVAINDDHEFIVQEWSNEV